MVTLNKKDSEKFIRRMIHTEKRSTTHPEKVTTKKIMIFDEAGKNLNWNDFDKEIVEENKKLEDWMINNFGPRCPDFEKGCIVCEKWKLYDKLKMEI